MPRRKMWFAVMKIVVMILHRQLHVRQEQDTLRMIYNKEIYRCLSSRLKLIKTLARQAIFC